MGEFIHDEGKGSLFKQDNWTDGSGIPMMTGSCKINGKTYKIAAWANTAQKSGKKYLGLKFELEGEVVKDKVEETAPSSDDLPF